MTEQSFSLATRFLQLQPRSAARVLEQCTEQDAADFLLGLDMSMIHEIVEQMSTTFTASLLELISEQQAADILNRITINSAALILRKMPKRVSRPLIKSLGFHVRKEINLILDYSEDTVGAWMDPNIMVLTDDLTVAQALTWLAKNQESLNSHDLYIVDANKVFVGIIPIKRLLSAETESGLQPLITRNRPKISGRKSLEAAKSHSAWDWCDSLAVLNRQKQLIGHLCHCDLRRGLKKDSHVSAQSQQQATEYNYFSLYKNVLLAIFNLIVGFAQQNKPRGGQ
jgi:Mg/Co/Ni transporter MgtE